MDLSGTLSGSNDDSGTDSAYGAGAAFIFGKHLGIRAEYEQFNVADTDKTDMVSVGVDLRF